MKPAGGGSTATLESKSVDAPLSPPLPWPCPADVRLCGHLRKQKSQRLRFFVLRSDPPRLECYESEKKFRAGGCRPARPQRSLSLEGACTISKRADARQRHLIVLYTRDSSLGVAAASEAEQQAWYSALLEVRAAAAAAASAAAGPISHKDPEAWILAPFQDVWAVTLRPKGLGRTRGLGSGGYRLCLGSGALSLLRKPGSKGSRDGRASPLPALRLSLLSVRRCGHADSFFFLELGRSAPTGPGELWLQAPDAVVAQSIHETVLAAMKRLGGSGAGGKDEPLSRDLLSSVSISYPISPYETPALAAQPKGLGERMEQGTLKTLPRLGTTASHSNELDGGEGYIDMGAGDNYVHMAGGEVGGYVLMAPPGTGPTTTSAASHQDRGTTGYVPMNSFPPGSLSCKAEPKKPKPKPRRTLCSIRDSRRPGDTQDAQPCPPPPSELAGEYVYIQSSATNCTGMGTARPQPPNSSLNYIDLDLVPPLEALSDVPRAGQHSYAHIEF